MRNVIFKETLEGSSEIFNHLLSMEFPDFIFATKQMLGGGFSPDSIGAYLNANNDIGSFAILGDDRSLFERSFPNNFVQIESDVEKTCKNVVYIMTNFGRDSRNMDRVFITSDSHFFHANIIKYCNRPWNAVDEMNDALVENWNGVVGKDDKVIHLGDFSFGNRKKVEEIFHRLNGRIELVMGNHDRLAIKDYYDIGFRRVYDRPVVYGNFFILSHAPLQWIKDGDVYCNIYGHVHNMEMYKTWTKNTCCACVERHEYKPISFESIKSKFKELNSMELT